jgi:hypothetical protein
MRAVIQRTSLYPHAVDGVLVGWVGQGSHAPNIARVSALKAGLPEKVQAYTIQQNCISSLETVASAYRHIIMGEGDLYLAGGTESMSNFPYVIRGPRDVKALRSIETAQSQLGANSGTTPTSPSTTPPRRGSRIPSARSTWRPPPKSAPKSTPFPARPRTSYALGSYQKGLAAEKRGFLRHHTWSHRPKNGVTKFSDETNTPTCARAWLKSPACSKRPPRIFDGSILFHQGFLPGQRAAFILGEKSYEEGKTKGTLSSSTPVPAQTERRW